MYIFCTKGERFIMKIKKLSVLFAVLLFVAAFCMAGCENSSQAPEALVVSIYKVEKEQDEDGNVYITNYDLWKSYNVTPTQAIDLPDYDPEKEDKDCKILYEDSYRYNTDINSSSSSNVRINGYFFACKNKIQFIPYASSIIFARERKKKTINFFYEGKNITEYLDETQIENYNDLLKDTYTEDFNIGIFRKWFETFFTGTNQTVMVKLYASANGDKSFGSYTIRKYVNSYYNDNETRYSSDGGSFTLIKSTDVYLKITVQ